ncbi:ABC transporter G family member 23 [Frankliniella fusca]|uniref:ABC transporter G family member 23 n=1 Tax=Frankliniella fusca TaxID=407009 RepID=A0AAE1LIY9_9NEOP|nr:ABC transporter G family member 23 [Frankliniella fusca]
MLHAPPLLVLDEPTVGLDPLLRHSTWELLRAAAARGTAVVISTHYTEEAVNADTVGLLRDGRMVVEDSPAAILDRHGGHGDSSGAGLEEAVLCLCVSLTRTGTGGGSPPDSLGRPDASRPAPHQGPQPLYATGHDGHTFAALLWKDVVFLRRHWAELAAQALFFVMITVLACVVLGHWPRGIRVDVVSDEASCDAPSPSSAASARAEPLSCAVLRALPPRGLSPVQQADVSAAARAVRSGASWAVLHFGANFSLAFVERVVHGGDDDDVLRASEIEVHLDATDFVISNMISRRLAGIVSDLVRRMDPSRSNFIKFEDPVFGRAEPVNTETLMPGVLLGYMTTFAASLVMSTLLTEKSDRLLERTLVSGARAWQLLACWVAVLVPVVLAVNLVSHALIFGALALPCAGSTAHMYLLCSALCVMTMLAGLLFASVFDNYIAAILSCHQFAVSFLFLSGVLWPLQAMHWSLRAFALVMPWAHSMEAARAVLQRGWGLGHRQVWLGFGTCAIWAGLFVAGLVLVHRSPKRVRKRLAIL